MKMNVYILIALGSFIASLIVLSERKFALACFAKAEEKSYRLRRVTLLALLKTTICSIWHKLGTE